MNKRPVLIIWSDGKGSQVCDSKKDAATVLGTSVSHIYRLIESRKRFRRGDRYCFVDELLEVKK